MIKKLLAAVTAAAAVAWGSSFVGRAATINAASCSQQAVSDAIGQAATNDTVVIPNGTCTWSSQLDVTKDIVLSGSGNTNITIASNIVTVLHWSSPNTGLPRLTNIKWFTGTGISGHCDDLAVEIDGTNQNFRTDNNTFTTQGRQLPWLGYHGNIAGIIDHNTVNVNDFVIPICFGRNNYGGVGWYGDNSWAQPSTFGTPDATYVEDNTFTNNMGSQWVFAMDGCAGSRVVIRKNTFNNIFFGNHGLETCGRQRSARQWEYYDNTTNISTLFFPSAMSSRGGTGYVFDNVATAAGGSGLNQVMDFNTYRSNPSNWETSFNVWSHCGVRNISGITRVGTTATITINNGGSGATGFDSGGGMMTILSGSYAGDYLVFPNSGNTVTTTVSSGLPASSGATTYNTKYDQNTDSTGYRCTDQIGAGPGILYSGDGSGFGGVSPYASNQQTLEPSYVFNNLYNGSLSAAVLASGASVSENRDYYNQASSFNGTVGVGRGTLASRPNTCTSGVGYWATDQGEWDSTHGGADGRFYKCIATNTWALQYTPYTYPHPLTQGQVPTTGPALTITSPTTAAYFDQTTNTVSISGTCTTCTSVTYTLNGGSSQAASGTTSFSISSVTIPQGDNTFVFTGSDGTLTGQATIHIFYLPNPGTPVDDFSVNYTQGLGPQWLQIGAGTMPARSGGFAVASGFSFDCVSWVPQSPLDANQETSLVIQSVSGSAAIARAAVNVSGTTNSNLNALVFQTDGVAGTAHTSLAQFLNGAFSELLAISTPGVTGDTIKVRRQSGVLTAFVNGISVGSTSSFDPTITGGTWGMCLTGPASVNSFLGADAGTGVQPIAPIRIRRSS